MTLSSVSMKVCFSFGFRAKNACRRWRHSRARRRSRLAGNFPASARRRRQTSPTPGGRRIGAPGDESSEQRGIAQTCRHHGVIDFLHVDAVAGRISSVHAAGIAPFSSMMQVERHWTARRWNSSALSGSSGIESGPYATGNSGRCSSSHASDPDFRISAIVPSSPAAAIASGTQTSLPGESEKAIFFGLCRLSNRRQSPSRAWHPKAEGCCP